MTISTHPTSVQEYRNQTAKPAHAGVMSPTFKCSSCNGFKRTSGRVKHPSGGYKCVDCAVRKEM